MTKVNRTYKDTLFRLSDSFSHREEEPELELKVLVYNINKLEFPQIVIQR